METTSLPARPSASQQVARTYECPTCLDPDCTWDPDGWGFCSTRIHLLGEEAALEVARDAARQTRTLGFVPTLVPLSGAR